MGKVGQSNLPEKVRWFPAAELFWLPPSLVAQLLSQPHIKKDSTPSSKRLLGTHRLWTFSKLISFEHLQELIHVRSRGQNHVTPFFLQFIFRIESLDWDTWWNPPVHSILCYCGRSSFQLIQISARVLLDQFRHCIFKSKSTCWIISYDQVYQLTLNVCWSLTHLLVVIQQVIDSTVRGTLMGTGFLHKVICGHNVVTLLNRTQWYTARLVIKNGSTTKRHVYRWDWLYYVLRICALFFMFSWEGICHHIQSQRIFPLPPITFVSQLQFWTLKFQSVYFANANLMLTWWDNSWLNPTVKVVGGIGNVNKRPTYLIKSQIPEFRLW